MIIGEVGFDKPVLEGEEGGPTCDSFFFEFWSFGFMIL